jgi:hypothetical protein
LTEIITSEACKAPRTPRPEHEQANLFSRQRDEDVAEPPEELQTLSLIDALEVRESILEKFGSQNLAKNLQKQNENEGVAPLPHFRKESRKELLAGLIGLYPRINHKSERGKGEIATESHHYRKPCGSQGCPR